MTRGIEVLFGTAHEKIETGQAVEFDPQTGAVRLRKIPAPFRKTTPTVESMLGEFARHYVLTYDQVERAIGTSVRILDDDQRTTLWDTYERTHSLPTALAAVGIKQPDHPDQRRVIEHGPK